MTMIRSLVILILASSIVPLFAQVSASNRTHANTNSCTSSFVVTAPVDVEKDFISSGWMGDGEKGKQYLQMTPVTGENPRPNDENNVVMKVRYQVGSIGWAGVYWQWPPNNWGDKPVKQIKGATKVTFWAAGQKGGEIVEFKAGGVTGKPCQDSFEVSLGRVALTKQWKRYEILLRRDERTPLAVVGAFAWVAEATPGGLTFFIDSIRYE